MKTIKFIACLGGLVLFISMINSCNDSLDGTTFFTTDDMTIIQTLEANPEQFSSYVEILKKTDFYNALKSYGSYTCFVPTNDGVETFLQNKWGVNSVDELNTDDQIEFLKILVKFQTLPSERGASSFIEGRVPDTTYTGDYLTTSFLLGGGISNVLINKEVKLAQYDIETTNGRIHAIDGVLSPFIKGVPGAIEDGGNHTIFVEALKQTGYYDTFSVIFSDLGPKNNFTIFAESDEIYSQEGINSFEDLANHFSPDNSDYTDKNNELNRFIAYHATQTFLYTADFPKDGFINTVLENNAVKSFKTDKILKLNETETGVDDTWTSLISEGSNFPARNGVYHTVDKLLTIFVPNPKYIIFDPVSDQPEIQAGLIRSGNYVSSNNYQFIRWFPENVNIRYILSSNNPSYDWNTLTMRGIAYIEFDTPVLPKGQYELRICSNGGNRARSIYQIYWDGEPIGGVYDGTFDVATVGFPDDEILMEANNWIRGKEDCVDRNGNTAYDRAGYSRFIVTKELLCPVQKRHVIRFETIKTGGLGLDYIEFDPVLD